MHERVQIASTTSETDPSGDNAVSEVLRLVHPQKPCFVPIASIRVADSPRLAGEDEEHTTLLAGVDHELPPIIVHRDTMRVIDGMHRLKAAMLRGRDTIEVNFFDGAEEIAFVLAVEENTRHGLPLSLQDRQAAAERIIGSHPHWSDRAIAKVVGLAAKTVGAIRLRTHGTTPQDGERLGRDGRVRPLNGAEGRRRASEIIESHPDVPLRELAKKAGISPATARDVRERMRRGDDPIPLKQRNQCTGQDTAPPRRSTPRIGRRSPTRDRTTILRSLRRDPSLRLSDSGRSLLRWLENNSSPLEECEQVAAKVPAHCVDLIVEFAVGCAADWIMFSEQIQQRVRSSAE
jgi:ParB-like chromosome segregation protein Spo0J